MQVTTESNIVIRLTEKEAGILIDLLALISGDPDSTGRAFADGLRLHIESRKVIRVCAFDTSGEISSLPDHQ